MFCPKCGSMMVPDKGKVKYVCRNSECDYEEEIKATKTIKSSGPVGEDVAIVKDDVVTLPKTRVICPECGHTEAYFNIRQTRSADEPSTTFYRCCKCNHSWREY